MLKHLKDLQDKKVAFAVYKLPNSDEVKLFYQKNDELHLTFDFSEAGFLMAPFAETDFYSFIPSTYQDSFTITSDEPVSDKKGILNEDNKEFFIDLVIKPNKSWSKQNYKKWLFQEQ